MKIKQTQSVILLLASLYFIAMAFPNALGARDSGMLVLTSQDESFQYPFLMRMLTPGQSLHETVKHIVSYQHYIYGYPFYITSAIVSIPLRILFGEGLANHTRIHLLTLRQLVSVLPMLASIFILVFLQTRFRSPFRSIALFLFLITIPGIVRQNLNWWHPDALAIFFATLTVYFLDKDRFSLGKYFYLAAFFCGLSTGTKLIGVFFFISILVYWVYSIRSHPFSINMGLRAGAVFVLVMLATIILFNPLLLFSETRQAILITQIDHNQAFSQGWLNSPEYQKGPASWLPVLERWYAAPLFLLFAFISMLVGAIKGQQKVVNLLWIGFIIPYSSYLLFRIAVRPDHYWLPVILPLFSGLFGILSVQKCYQSAKSEHAGSSYLQLLSMLVITIILGWQGWINIQKNLRLFSDALNQETLLIGCTSNPYNQKDGANHSLDTEKWYLIEEYDLSSQPQTRGYHVITGSEKKSISANDLRGELAYECQNQDVAYLRALKDARDYKLSFPVTIVIGPDGQAIP